MKDAETVKRLKDKKQLEFIQILKGIRDYWLSLPDKTAEVVANGILFSILVLIDGDSSENDFHALHITDSVTNERIDCGYLHDLLFSEAR